MPNDPTMRRRTVHQSKTKGVLSRIAVRVPLSATRRIVPARTRGRGHGRTAGRDGGRDAARAARAMLNVPTLWTVFVVNFLALGLIWAYVTRCYPKFAAARFWMASSLRRRRLGAMAALVRLFVDLAAAASCSAAPGSSRRAALPPWAFSASTTGRSSWRVMAATGLSLGGVVFFMVGYDTCSCACSAIRSARRCRWC